ncbi:hypothetical protein [Acetobacter orleanensis]|uniref:Lipoprotein n=1 Tax=Acetobacter orleanensis TaxID=104099 RepID=A0A4Y3TM38_9PROT|nr:hypothetical protein [Acetobacter orleanensis]KXV62882.1 hypothetical protein AD949_09010 [Acetobacter orleanensis]PCD80658.1 hypothetical protein CO710_02740 [Acetobacter orleanensis]GAN68001.1 hypothetical protein Abol_014_052 [Acetobacter orleanensis JCM 7639]GBR27384.1 hypothetical protein AA0473_1420 [Acetobacter orleanensis NRIC 0473]GEB82077.1 hypothetical protein AOR01nite_05540 [Acetobacter orleanensis]
MSLFSRPLRATCSVALLLPAFLAGCAGDTQPTHFAPLRYDYLSVMHLNAGTLDIEDKTLQNPVPGDIGPNAPTPPAQALRQMAQDRLVAAGSSGTAKFVIDRASILHNAGGVLVGQMAVHLELLNSGGTQAARAEAHVSETIRPDLSKGDADSPANLYELTKDMMQRMNVEFEYQVRKTLKDWMVDAGGTPVGSAIQSQSLDAPGAKTSAARKGAAAAIPVAATGLSSTPAFTTPAVTTPEITTPTVTVPTVTTPTVSVPDATPSATVPENAPATDGTADSATPNRAAPAQSSEPDPVFPAGEDNESAAPATPKVRSPEPGVLKLPKR